jgi:putative ABC transport system substrate-binding protein
VTNSGTIVKVFDTVDVLAENVPVVSLLPDLVQEGDISAVMSVGVSFDSNSILAAVYGVRILSEGVDPGSLPVGVITPPDVAISFAKAREIGLQIPFTMFESATFVYDPQGKLAREKGQLVP